MTNLNTTATLTVLKGEVKYQQLFSVDRLAIPINIVA
jgi:hypothetical protein